MTADCHLAEQGQMPPPARHHHCSGESLLCAMACSFILMLIST
jgi:hypothetical protein